MATTEQGDPALRSMRERPKASDIKQLFERYRTISRHLDDAERPRTSWLSPKSDRKRGSAVPGVRLQRATGELIERVMRRTAAGELRWAVAQYPTNGAAAEAEMSLAAYEDFVYRACLCHRDDPIAAWHEEAERIARLVDWASGREEVRLVGPGTDLTLNVGGRTFLAADGRRNMPDGELFTGPREESAEGEITFHLPTSFGGREVAGVRVRFEAGRVV